MPDPSSDDWVPVTPQAKQPAGGGDWIPVAQPTQPYTGEILPLRRDESGLHLAVPGIITNAIELMKRGGQAATGAGPMPTPQEAVGMAALGASAAPGVLRTTLAAAPSAAQRLAQDYRAAGIAAPAPMISSSRAAGIATQAGKALPVVGQAVRSGLEPALARTAERAGEVARGFGTPIEGGQAEAGAALQNTLRQFAADRSEFQPYYQEFDRLMHGAAPRQPLNTARAINELRKTYPDLPQLMEMVSPEGGRVARLIHPDQTSMSGVPFLNPQEMRDLRGSIAPIIRRPVFGPGGMRRADATKLYKAISEDMRQAATARGPAALRAFTMADRQFSLHKTSIDQLDSLINAPTAERAIARLNNAAMEQGGDARLLRAARRAMTPDVWNDLSASVVARLGKPTAGAKDTLSITPDFSATSFSTNWNKLSGTAKNLLFGPDQPGSPRAALEGFARITQSIKNLGGLANVSHSGEFGATYILWRDIAAALAAGHFGFLPVAAGAWGVAKTLMSPKVADMIYRMPAAGVGMPAAARTSLVGTRLAPASSVQNPMNNRNRTPPQIPNVALPLRQSHDEEYIEPPRASVVGP